MYCQPTNSSNRRTRISDSICSYWLVIRNGRTRFTNRQMKIPPEVGLVWLLDEMLVPQLVIDDSGRFHSFATFPSKHIS